MDLIALAIMTSISNTRLERGTISAKVWHQGPPVPYQVELRTKENVSDQWQYVDNIRAYPKRQLTSEKGKKVTVKFTGPLLHFIQICASIAPQKSSGSRAGASFGLRTCSNVPRPSSD